MPQKRIFDESDFAGAPKRTFDESDFAPVVSGTIAPAPSFATRMYREGKAGLGSLLEGAGNTFLGLGKGGLNTTLGVSKMLGRVPPNTTLEDIGMAPENDAQRLGMAVEQMGEFLVPEVGVTRLRGLFNLGRIGNVALHSGLEAAVSGGLSSLQGTTDPTIPAIAGAAGPLLSKPLGALSAKMYGSALKPSTTLGAAERAGLVSTGLEEGIPVSRSGQAKASRLVHDLNAQIRGQLDPNVTIPPSSVAQRIDQVRPQFRSQVNPEAELAALDASKAEFLRQHQTPAVPPRSVLQKGNVVQLPGIPPQDIPIPSTLAQDLKTGTYRRTYARSGEQALTSASKTGQTTLARGLKEELEAAFPKIKGLNAREGRLLSLIEALEPAVNRIANRDLVGIGSPIAGTAVGALSGNPMAGEAVGLAKLLPPGASSRFAIALNTARKKTLGPLAAALLAQANKP